MRPEGACRIISCVGEAKPEGSFLAMCGGVMASSNIQRTEGAFLIDLGQKAGFPCLYVAIIWRLSVNLTALALNSLSRLCVQQTNFHSAVTFRSPLKESCLNPLASLI